MILRDQITSRYRNLDEDIVHEVALDRLRPFSQFVQHVLSGELMKIALNAIEL